VAVVMWPSTPNEPSAPLSATATAPCAVQCGDPIGQGVGTPGYQFDDVMPGYLAKVSDEGMAVYPRGAVAMANAGSGTNGCQFFMVYRDSTIPGQYSADDVSPKVPVTIQRVVVG